MIARFRHVPNLFKSRPGHKCLDVYYNIFCLFELKLTTAQIPAYSNVLDISKSDKKLTVHNTHPGAI